jgi:hypothetical protein
LRTRGFNELARSDNTARAANRRNKLRVDDISELSEDLIVSRSLDEEADPYR